MKDFVKVSQTYKLFDGSIEKLNCLWSLGARITCRWNRHRNRLYSDHRWVWHQFLFLTKIYLFSLQSLSLSKISLFFILFYFIHYSWHWFQWVEEKLKIIRLLIILATLIFRPSKVFKWIIKFWSNFKSETQFSISKTCFIDRRFHNNLKTNSHFFWNTKMWSFAKKIRKRKAFINSNSQGVAASI